MRNEQIPLFDDLPVYLGHVSKHRLYAVWRSMVQRCHKPGHAAFPDYGQRGIVVCDEWRASSRAFVAWAIKAGWQAGLQLDRKDNDGPYSPANCRFVTARVNTNNRRNTRRLPDGTPLTVAAHAAGLSESTLDARLRLGWSLQDALSRRPADRRKHVLPDGTSLANAARAAGLRVCTVRKRLSEGWSLQDALSRAVVDPRKHVLPDGTSLADAARAAGLRISTVRKRLRLGWSLQDAVSRRLVSGVKHVLPDGTPVVDAARSAGLSVKTVQTRLRLGWSLQDAVSIPSGGKRPAATAAVALDKGQSPARRVVQGDKRSLSNEWQSVGSVAARLLVGMNDLPRCVLPRPIHHPGYPESYLSKELKDE